MLNNRKKRTSSTFIVFHLCQKHFGHFSCSTFACPLIISQTVCKTQTVGFQVTQCLINPDKEKEKKSDEKEKRRNIFLSVNTWLDAICYIITECFTNTNKTYQLHIKIIVK